MARVLVCLKPVPDPKEWDRLKTDAMVTIPAGGTAEIAKIVIGRTTLAHHERKG